MAPYASTLLISNFGDLRSVVGAGVLVLVACGGQSSGSDPGAASVAASSGTSAEPLPDQAFTGGPWQRLTIPGEGSLQALVSAPDGWYALRRQDVALSNGGKVLPEYVSQLLSTTDGLRWESSPLATLDETQGYRGLAYGNGTFVLAGGGTLLVSDDARNWSTPDIPAGSAGDFDQVAFVGERFFALSTFRRVLTSANGADWTLLNMPTIQQGGVAYGNGSFLMTGGGPIQLSTDGVNWVGADLNCTLPDACVTAPDGQVFQGLRGKPRFLNGLFYVNELQSLEGRNWSESTEQAPHYAIGDWLIRQQEGELLAWRGEQAPIAIPVLENVRTLAASDTELSCRSRSCIQLGDELYLIP